MEYSFVMRISHRFLLTRAKFSTKSVASFIYMISNTTDEFFASLIKKHSLTFVRRQSLLSHRKCYLFQAVSRVIFSYRAIPCFVYIFNQSRFIRFLAGKTCSVHIASVVY